MECANLLIVVGLSLDIFGAILIWAFGVPRLFNRTPGDIYKVKAKIPEEESIRLRKVKIFDYFLSSGIFLLILGFVLQLIANLVQGEPYVK